MAFPPSLPHLPPRMERVILRFDFTGLGSSGGEFANTSFVTKIDDLVAAADYLRAEYKAPSLLIGHRLAVCRT